LSSDFIQLVGPWKLGAAASPVKRQTENGVLVLSIEEDLVTQIQAKPPCSTRLPDLQGQTPETTGNVTEGKTAIKGYQKGKINFTDYATPASAVSAFCRAVLLKIIPPRFWGDGPEALENRKIIMKHVDSFIKMRRFESPSLHEVCSGLKVRFVVFGY
jgi:telomerase reverse transcriptase